MVADWVENVNVRGANCRATAFTLKGTLGVGGRWGSAPDPAKGLCPLESLLGVYVEMTIGICRLSGISQKLWQG
jgi:hypothetical protein